MDATAAAERFLDLFHDVFLRFQRRRGANERELSIEALGVLEHLSRTGPLTVTEAARHFDRSQSSTSEVLARLEQHGLLVRYADERDRRRTLVWLSEAGLAEWRQSRRTLDTVRLGEALQRLPPGACTQVLDSLALLLAHATPTAPTAADREP